MKEINNNIREDYCSFEVSKLFKEKGFDVTCLHFYTNPRSKMYGVDENFRFFSIKNTPRKLYTCGQHATKNSKNVFFAPTHALAIEWLRINFGIWITITSISQESWQCHITKKGDSLGKLYFEDFNSPQEATDAALKYVLEKLI